MNTLKCFVRQNHLQIENEKTVFITSGNANYIQIEADLDSDWEDLTITAVSGRDQLLPALTILKDKSCIIPWEVTTEPGILYIGFVGIKKDKRLTTNVVNVRIQRGPFVPGVTPLPPSVDIYQQVIEAMQEIIADAGEILGNAKEQVRIAADFAEKSKASSDISAEHATQTAQDLADTTAALTETQQIKVGVTADATQVHADRDAVTALSEAVSVNTARAETAALDAEVGRAAVAEMRGAVSADKIAVEALQSEINSTVSNFKSVTLPASIKALKDEGKALIDVAKGHADSASQSVVEAQEKLDAINQATTAFSSTILSTAMKSVNDAGAAQIKAVQGEGAVQITRAAEQADRAKVEADRAAAIDAYDKIESGARYAPVETVGRVDDLESLLPTTTESGTGSVTLDNCAALAPRSLIVWGGARQEALVDFEAIAQEVVSKYPNTAKIETVDGKRCLVCTADNIYYGGLIRYSGSFRAGLRYTATMTAKEIARVSENRKIQLLLRYRMSDGTYINSNPIESAEWETVSVSSSNPIDGIGWIYNNGGTIAISIDDFKVAPSIQPTPEHPITPVFVGTGGKVDVTVCGENCCNPDDIIHGYSANGVIVTGAAQTMIFCPCQPDCAYTISKPLTSRFIIYESTDAPEVGTALSQLASGADQTLLSVRTSANAHYLLVYIHHSSFDTDISAQEAAAQTMVVQGTYTADTMPPYTPYEGKTHTTTLPHPLVGPEDTVDLVSGAGESVWTAAVLDGSEKWTKSGKTAANGTVFYVNLPNQDLEFTRKAVLSSHFRDSEAPGALMPGDIWLYNTAFVAVANDLLGIAAEDTDAQKVDKFKTWLAAEAAAGRPVTIWYQSTTPTEITDTPRPELIAQRGTTNIVVTGGSGEPVPEIKVTVAQDPNLLILEQVQKNKSLEERLNALEAKTLGV